MKTTAHLSLEFRILHGPFGIPPGRYTAAQIKRLLTSAKVDNFASIVFKDNQREFEVTESRSGVIIAKVHSRISCELGSHFMMKAREAGLGLLDLGAGPFIALESLSALKNIIPFTSPFGISGLPSREDNLLWKILYPGGKSTVLNLRSASDRIEGEQIMAFAQL